ncbi:MAG: methyltransferase domain-containing protein [Ilumatobacter sp.]|uniref:methyltransferase domain-containing protein n=1 Tax=Ilumatobacter sp. TaxID=1967498 RepID=UPI0026121723|nr:methyltransferase domain-containing protein [Ilumatobacter sp.]MDJ0768111.1 methyltransferase domain-containing protein [Ilumatobacter sp.]
MSDTTTNEPRHFGGSAGDESPVDRGELRLEVQAKYAAVALDPTATFHFHTGRVVAERCRYDMDAVDVLPGVAVESFAGVANPFELRSLEPGEHVVDLGSGAGFDSFLAAHAVGPEGRVVGVDMTDEMLEKSRAATTVVGVDNVEFRKGFLEDLPVEDEWADVVISNGVINLCPDKHAAFREAWRVLEPGGVLQFADIANGNDVPEAARREIDLWTG